MDPSQPWSRQAPPGTYASLMEQDSRSSNRFSYHQQPTPSAPPPPTISSSSNLSCSNKSVASNLHFKDSAVSPSYFPPAPPPFTPLETSIPPPLQSSSFVSSFVPLQRKKFNRIFNDRLIDRSNNIEINLQDDLEQRMPRSPRYPQRGPSEPFRNPDSPFDHGVQGSNPSHVNRREPTAFANDEVIAKQPNREAKRQSGDSDDFGKMLGIIKLKEDVIEGDKEDELRCNFCPSPGLVKQHEKASHVQVVHFSSLFLCAACPKKGFEEFGDLVVHINNEHQVTDTEMVFETIKLPEGRDKLKMWRCGVTNCRKKFVGLSELILKSHMHNNHGSYYLKVGKGKYLQRFCRICGDDRSFGSEQDLDHHIASSHPLHQFAPSLDTDSDAGSDIVEIVRIKQEPGEKNVTPKTKTVNPNQQKIVSAVPTGPPRHFPNKKRLDSDPRLLGPNRSPMKSPVPMFGEPIPQETNRILQETSHLIKDHPLVFEEQKKRILGENSRKYPSNQTTFGQPFPQDYLRRYPVPAASKLSMSIEDKTPHETSGFRTSSRPATKLRRSDRSASLEKERVSETRSVSYKQSSRKSSSSSSGSSSDSRSPSPKQKKGKKTSTNKKQVSTMSTKQIKACLDGLADKEHKIKKKVVKPPTSKNTSPSLFSKAIHKLNQQPGSIKPKNKNIEHLEMGEMVKKSPKKVCLPEMLMPKFMLNGKPAYYICELCQEPVGTVLEWIKHRTKKRSHLALYTKEYSKSKDVKEVHVSSNPSILEKFGDKNKKCLACGKSFMNNEDLRLHEDEWEHKTKLKAMELNDAAELKTSGEKIKTLFYCDICEISVGHPAMHVKDYSHVGKLKITKRCYYCPKRFDPQELLSHINLNHSKNLFKCTECPTQMITKVKMLDHIKMNHADVRREFAIFTPPLDLRKMKCGVCSEGVFMSQDTSQVMNHILNEHPKSTLKSIKFGCQACPQLSFENDDIMNRHVQGFHEPELMTPKLPERGFNPVNAPIQSQKGAEKTLGCLDDFYVTRKNPELSQKPSNKSSSGTSRKRSSSSRSKSRSYSRSRSRERHNKSRSRSGRPSSRLSENDEEGRKLFVGGLSKDTKDYDLKKHFEQWGRLTDYKVMQDSDGYGSRCFGFITFARKEDLDYCMECRVHLINNKKVGIKEARPLNTSKSHERGRRKSNEQSGSSRGRLHRSPRRRSSRSPGTSRRSGSPKPRRRSRSPGTSRRSRSRQRSDRSPRKSRRSRSGPRTSPSSSRTTRRFLDRLTPSPPRTPRTRRSRSNERMPRADDKRRNTVVSREAKGITESPIEKKIIHMQKSVGVLKNEDNSSCPFCQEGFPQQETTMAQHISQKHSSQMFHCDLCRDFSGWNRQNLQQHLASAHGKQIKITDLLKNYTLIPSQLQRINCKLCQPPYILGSPGFWIANNLTNRMPSIFGHFLEKHSITDVAAVGKMLELACRGCDTTFNYGDRYDWMEHVGMDHSRSTVPPPGKGQAKEMVECGYCDESVTASESIPHIQEAHSEETFLCKICLDVDKNCFPFFDKMKEMMSHMVLKHGNEFSSYYDHIIYPKNLGWMRCIVKGCESRGKFLAYNRDLLKDHGMYYHSGLPDRKFMAIHCRNCEGVKEQFEDDAQLKEHVDLKHKQIVAWKAKNGHN